MSSFERLYMQQPSTKPRVYKILPGSERWWADCVGADGTRHLSISSSHAAAIDKAAKYAAGVYE